MRQTMVLALLLSLGQLLALRLSLRMNPHIIACIIISCAAFGVALAALSISLVAIQR